jgi:ABC-2 type transport system ATP-binding protein
MAIDMECRMHAVKIDVQNLGKKFRVPVRGAGLAASIQGLLRPTYREVEAVRQVSFQIDAGEIVGLIGPNGAGKTTMLKMLSGLLYPSAGQAHVAGFTPWERRPEYLRGISMVMGNKSQMLWDIPPLDSFDVLAEIYTLEPRIYRQTLDELVELLDMADLLAKPVRSLSLGERMKCELVAGLLHKPSILFLDEPTLGLDVSMQGRLRRFLAEYNRRSGVTMILTSHYMADVVALCPRVILIHHGSLLYDGELDRLARRLAPFKLISLSLRNGSRQGGNGWALPAGVDVVEQGNGRLVLRVGRAEAPSITAHLLKSLPVADLAVEDPPIEAVIDQIYSEEVKP